MLKKKKKKSPIELGFVGYKIFEKMKNPFPKHRFKKNKWL